MTVLLCSGVAKRFGERDVLRGVDLRVDPGEIVALVGSNGAGKSTLLRLAAGLMLPCTGRIEVAGTRPERARAMQTIGWVASAETSFSRRLSLRANLLHNARLAGLQRRHALRRISALADLLGFSDHLDVPAERCSSGIRQRAALARAKLHSPRLLLLDEPLRSVDGTARPELAQRLRGIRRDGAIVWVSHDRAEVEAVAHRVVRLKDGAVREIPGVGYGGRPRIRAA